jgi:hypothetical protein
MNEIEIGQCSELPDGTLLLEKLFDHEESSHGLLGVAVLRNTEEAEYEVLNTSEKDRA